MQHFVASSGIAQVSAEAVAGILGAGATAAGVIAALWIALRADRARARKNAPVLSVEISRGLRDITLLVGNALDRSTARNVEVLIFDLEHNPAYSVTRRAERFWIPVEPVNRSLEWSDGSNRIDIQPGLSREVRLASVAVDPVGADKGPPIADLHVPGGPLAVHLTLESAARGYCTDLPSYLKNGTGRVRFAVIADNVNAAYFTAEIGWPWEMPWKAMVGVGGFSAELRTGHTKRWDDDHLVTWSLRMGHRFLAKNVAEDS